MDASLFYNDMQDKYEMDRQTHWVSYIVFIIIMLLLLMGILYAGYN